MSVSVHPILRLAIGILFRRRRAAHKLTLDLCSAIGATASDGDISKANALWRGAIVQMRAINTASAWPLSRRREMRAEAEARLDKYFAQVERIIAADRLTRFHSASQTERLARKTNS
jgi:hypothetical protein